MIEPRGQDGFDKRVLAPLRRLGRSIRQRVLLAGCCRVACVGAMLCTAQFVLDATLSLGLGPRAALLAGLLLVVGYQAWHHLLKPLGVRMRPLDLASVLERHMPELRDQLVSAVAFAGTGTLDPTKDSPVLVDHLVNDACAHFDRINPAEVLNQRRHRRVWALSVGLVAILLAVRAGAPDLFATYVARDLLLRDTPWPSRTRIRIEGMVNETLHWPVGDDLTLVATAEGEVPAVMGIEIELPDGRVSARPTARRGENQFLLEYGPLDQSLRLRFVIWKIGVDERTTWSRILAIERPAIRTATLTITPPDYASQSPYSLPRDQTSAEVLRGSRVAILAEASKPLSKAALRTPAQSLEPAVIHPDGLVTADFAPAASGSYSFDLTDSDNLTDLHPMAFALRVSADPPPKARLTLPGVGEMIVASAVPRVMVECEDNLGLRQVVLRYRATSPSADAASSQPAFARETLPGFEPGTTKYSSTRDWPLSGLGLRPGDQLMLFAQAADYQPATSAERRLSKAAVPSTTDDGGPGVADSAQFTLKVVTPEELLNELARRESEWRRELEHIIKAQEQINGRVRELHDAAKTGGMSAEISANYDRQERAQRAQSGRLKTVRRQFEQIWNELRTNQLADSASRRRLEDGILSPLGRLAGVDCPAAADRMDRLRSRYESRSVDEIEDAQSGLLRDMYAVLANMLKWEGYNEAVALVRDILRLQEDVNRQTQNRLDRQVQNLFGTDATSKPADGTPP